MEWVSERRHTEQERELIDIKLIAADVSTTHELGHTMPTGKICSSSWPSHLRLQAQDFSFCLSGARENRNTSAGSTAYVIQTILAEIFCGSRLENVGRVKGKEKQRCGGC